MLTLEAIRKKLQDRKLSVISEKTGISIPTLWKVRNGQSDPAYSTVKKLSDYMEEMP